MGKKIGLVLDAADPQALGAFWAFALDYVEEAPPDGFSSWEEALEAWNIPREKWGDAYAIVDPSGEGPRMYFQRVPEPKTAKNRLHLDVVNVPRASDGTKDWGQLRAAAARLVARGAVVEREFDEAAQGQWIVMNDPEGNEFCVV
jgi:hypothetical protein